MPFHVNSVKVKTRFTLKEGEIISGYAPRNFHYVYEGHSTDKNLINAEMISFYAETMIS
jgi:hypothetical protein